MATSIPLGGHGTFFVGEDKTFRLECLDKDPPDGVPVNMEGWLVVFEINVSDSATTPLIAITATIMGEYAETRASNTQRAEAQITETHSRELDGDTRYRYSFKRLDTGRKTVLARNYLIVEQDNTDQVEEALSMTG